MGEYKGTKTGERTPQIKFTREGVADAQPGTYFTGTKTSQRWVDETSIVFDFILDDGSEDLPILLKQDDKSWKAVAPTSGMKVGIFGGKSEKGVLNQIADKLLQVPEGQKVTMTFLGKKQNPKTKRYYNDFKVVDA